MTKKILGYALLFCSLVPRSSLLASGPRKLLEEPGSTSSSVLSQAPAGNRSTESPVPQGEGFVPETPPRPQPVFSEGSRLFQGNLETPEEQIALRTMANNVMHPQQLRAIQRLLDIADDDGTEEIRLALMALIQRETEEQWDAIEILWNSGNADSHFLRPVLLPIAHDPGHDSHWQAVEMLLEMEGENQTEDAAFFYPVLMAAAHGNTEDEEEWLTLRTLWGQALIFPQDPRPEIHPLLYIVATRNSGFYQWDALELLWNADGADQADTRERLLPTLRAIESDATNPYAEEARELLENAERAPREEYTQSE